MLRRISLLTWLLIVALLLTGSGRFAQAQTLPYQGILLRYDVTTGDWRAPVASTTVSNVTFRLWNVQTEGSTLTNLVWQGTGYSFTTTNQGAYSVTLNLSSGFRNNFTYTRAFAQNLWLEVDYNTDPNMPRTVANTVLPATSVDRMIYVANALYHIDRDKSQEKAAQAFFINTVFARNPAANPRLLRQILLAAQDRFDKQYRSFQTDPSYRYRMTSYEVTAIMLSILSATPGIDAVDISPLPANLVPLSATLTREALSFVASDQNWLYDNSLDYLQPGNTFGQAQAAGQFPAYLSTNLEKLYDTARTSVYFGSVVDIFFGTSFNASASQNAVAILTANPGLYTPTIVNGTTITPAFKSLSDSIFANNGALILAIDKIQTAFAAFRSNMDAALTGSSSVYSQYTTHQSPNYADYYNNTSQSATTQRQADLTALIAQKAKNDALLADTSSVGYALPFTIAPDPTYTAYEIARATIGVASATAHLVAASMEVGSFSALFKSGAPAAEAVAAGLELVGATMDLAAATGAFGKSPEEVIMDGINNLSTQLQQVEQNLSARIDIVNANITLVYRTMNQQFADLSNKLYVIGEKLDVLQATVEANQQQLLQLNANLSSLSQFIYDFSSASSRSNVTSILTAINSDIRALPLPSLSTQTLRDRFNALRSYATDTALNNVAEVGPALSSRLYTDLALYDELTKTASGSDSALPEWRINYILEFARRRFNVGDPNYTAVTGLGTNGTLIVNPRAWEMCASGMIRLAAYWPDVFAEYTRNDSASNGGSFASMNQVGLNYQKLVGAATVQGTIKSPLFPNLVRHYQLQATNLSNVFTTMSASRTTQQFVDYVKQQWNATVPDTNGINLQNAVKQLNGSKLLLDSFVNFGLSRTLERNDLLSSLLYSPQRLPDGSLVKALFDGWTSAAADPKTTFAGLVSGSGSTDRRNNLAVALDTILTNTLTQSLNRETPGELSPSVEVMRQRIAPYLNYRVGGNIIPAPGKFDADQPVQLTFTGTKSTFTIPITLPASGGTFSVSVPPDTYTVYILAPRFLRRRLNGINVQTANVTSLSISLLVGDISGDNKVNGTDLLLLRNAYLSTPASVNWNPTADLNGDGIVNQADITLLYANWGQVGS